MPIKVGEVEALFRYPVKSMRGEPVEVADLGWHGLDGDRRLAFRRADDRGSARPAAEVLKAIVRVRDNKAGVYGTTTRRGRLAVGQPIFFEPAAEQRKRP